MKQYRLQDTYLHDQQSEQNTNITTYNHRKQIMKQEGTFIQNINYILKNINQTHLLICLSITIIVLFSFSIIFKSSDHPINNIEKGINPDMTLTLLKNTLLYNKNVPINQIPIVKMGKNYNLDKSQIQRAIKNTQIVPLIKNKDPQKQSIYEELSKYDYQYMVQNYHINKLNENQIGFCVILPLFHQKEQTEKQNIIKSIIYQNYTNLKIVWSKSNKTQQNEKIEKIEKLMKQNQFPLSKSLKIQNSTQNALENIYYGIKKYCLSGQVVIVINNNVEFLIGLNVLSLFNAAYQQNKIVSLYTQFLKMNYQKYVVQLGEIPEIQMIKTQPNKLKQYDLNNKLSIFTFYTDLFLKIPIQSLSDNNEKFYSYIWQNVLYTKILELSQANTFYLNQITYSVNEETTIYYDRSKIKNIKQLESFKSQKTLQPLKQLNFIYKSKENILPAIQTNNPVKETKQSQTNKQSESKKQDKAISESQKLLKDEQTDLTVSQDQQSKVELKTKKQAPGKLSNKNLNKAKAISLQQTIPQKKIKTIQTKKAKAFQQKQPSEINQVDPSLKQTQLLKSNQNNPQKAVQQEDLKTPVLSNSFQNDRNPLADPKLVKPQKIQNDQKNQGDNLITKDTNLKQHRPQDQKLQPVKEQQIIIDGKKSIKSTQVLPNDQTGGFLQIDQEQSEEFNLPKITKNIPKKIAAVPTNKIMDVKGPNYTFKVSIQQMVNNADLQKIFGKKKSKQGIWKNQFLQAIKKLQITNNVKYGGQIAVELTKFDNDKFQKIKRIQQAVKTDTDYFQANYKISQYKKKQLPFCIVVPSYQNVQTGLYLRNLNSIFMQNYTNYRVVYIDDSSPDKTGEHVKSYIYSHNIPLQKIQVIINKDNRKPPYNIYNAITNHCKLGQLALIVEGDDALLGTNVLNLYNAIYQRDKCAMIYSSYLEIFQNSKVELGVGHQIVDQFFQKNSIRTISQIPGKYLLSFYVDVFKSIQVSQFKDPKGYFFWFAYDRALITPLLEVSYPRISIVKEILYEHRRDTDKTQSPNDWNRQSRQILAKKPYKPLKFFPFIERNKYKYFLDKPIDQVIQNSDFDAYTFTNNFQVEGITKDMHIRSIKLLQLIHNVKFGGQIQIQLAEYQSSKQQKKARIQKILQEDKNYYNQKYNIDFYRKEELPFCIVTPSYNNVKSGLYLRNLDSVFMQDYNNYHVVYIDDCSPDKTGQFVQKYLEKKKIPSKHIEVIINKQNKKAMYNLHMGIHKYCKSGEIVMIIDGDDSFLGRNVLSLFNAVYQKQKSAMAFSNFLTIHNNDRTQIGFCHDIDKQMFEQNTFRNSWDLPGTHLMSFYSDLFKKIKISDLTYPNGTFYDYAYDRAILTPLLQMAYPRIGVIKQITYEYRNDTGINDAPDDWSRVSHIILDKKPYAHLQEFPFIKGLIASTDKFNIKAEIQTVIKNTNLSVYDKEVNKKITGVAKQQHIHAIRLTQLVHNINFQGQIDVSLKYTKNAQKKKQRLEKLLKNDKQYLQTKYDISKYKQKQERFCIIVSSHNSVQNGLYLRNLNSIFMQDYKNYKIIFIDDNGSGQTKQYINKYLEQQQIPSHVIKIIRNQDPKKQLSNIYFAVHNQCQLNQIVLIVGENDALIGRNVLSVINARYQKQKAKVGYSCFLKVFNSSTELGTCGDINQYYFKTGTFRNHLQYEKYRLMSFYNYIFRQIKIKDLTFQNGTFFSTSLDKAIMIPLIQMTYPQVVVIKDIMYQDRFDKEAKDSNLQAIQTNIILSKQPYKKIDKISDIQP